MLESKVEIENSNNQPVRNIALVKGRHFPIV